MKHTDGTFTNVRGLNIYYQAWLPEGNINAILLIVHGIGEHSGRYTNVVNHFVPHGYAVYSFDNVGHGKSDNGREEIDRFEDLTEPLLKYQRMIEQWHPGKPIFIYGHSLGALITSFHILDHQSDFKGAIISAPLVKIPANISPFTVTMGKILSVIAPKAGLISLDTSKLSRDEHVIEKYLNDPLVFHGKTPARLSAEILRAMIRVTNEVDKISLPIFILQGSGDEIVDPTGAKMLNEEASSLDKTYKVYEGLYHEVHNEPDREMMFKDLEDWLSVRL